MAALFGVLSVVNVYTGTMFDIIFIYLMTVALAYYTFKFNEKMAVLVLFTSTFILFLTGELFFTLYSFFTLPLGILYIYCIKKKIDGKWILRVYSMLKNYIVLFLLNSLLGLNTFTDAKDIYYSIVGLFPFLESDFNFIECLRALKDYKVKGCIICESPLLEKDALLLKETYEKL